ncbi:MAG: hypothetical protein COA66_04845 [Arcobacter sp.]|nr:MAG: hypothetical protein COA66_04845 [Arcobacter sp.]
MIKQFKFLILVTALLCLTYVFVMFLLFDTSFMFYDDFIELKQSKIFNLIIMFVLLVILIMLLYIIKIKYDLFNKFKEKSTNTILLENEELKLYSRVDLITKAFNHEYFETRFEQEFKRAIRENLDISLLIVTTNDFIAYEELYGKKEAQGNLEKIANVLFTECSRPCDIIARIKEDKFYILLPNTRKVRKVALRCKKAVDKLNLDHDNSLSANIVRIKYGYASVLPTKIEEMKDLLKKAENSFNYNKTKRIKGFVK